MDPKDQFDVVAYYEERGASAGTVGEYVRVMSGPSEISAFGPVEDADTGPLGWKVVEINWEQESFLVAPNDVGLGDE